MASNTPSSSQYQPKSRLERLSAKSVLIPKTIVNIPLFTRYGIMDIFDCQGWRSLLIDDKPVFPYLVKQFYANLSFSSSTRVLKSFVQGKEIYLNEAILAQILNVPYEGWRIQSSTSWSNYPLTPLEQTRILMADDAIEEPFIPNICQLPAFTRIIQHLCFYNLFPRHPTQFRVSCPEMFLISMILSKRPTNFPGTVISFMTHVAARELSLPYGGILTHVFEYVGIDLTETETIPRQLFPSTFLDDMYFITLTEEVQSKSCETPFVEDHETTRAQNIDPVPHVISEDPDQFQDPQLVEPVGSHSLDDIYILLQDTNTRLANMEQHMLVLQNQQAQNTQTMNDLLAVLTNVFSVP